MPSKSLDIIIRGRDRASKELRGVNRAMERLNQTANRLAVTVAGFFAARSIARTGTAALKLAADFERTEMALSTLLHSGDQAKAMLRELEKFAAETPFEFPELQDTVKLLLALGVNARDVMPTLRTLGDATAAMGGSTELLNRMALALGQMKAKGFPSGEEMRQLAQAGIPAWEILAEKIGVSIPEAMRMAENRAIDISVAMPAILEGMNERFAGSTQNLLRTTSGLFAKVHEEIRFVLRDIGAMFIEAFNVKDILARASKELELFRNSLQFIGLTVKQTVLQGMLFLSRLWDHVRDIFTNIGGFIGTHAINIFSIFKTAFENIAQIARNLFDTELRGRILSNFFEAWKNLWFNAWQAVKNVALNIRDVFAAAFESIRTRSLEPFKDLVLRDLTEGFRGVVKEIDAALVDLVKGTKNPILVPFEPVPVGRAGFLTQVIQGAIEDIDRQINERIGQRPSLPSARPDEEADTEVRRRVAGLRLDRAAQLLESRFLTGVGRSDPQLEVQRRILQQQEKTARIAEQTRDAMKRVASKFDQSQPVVVGRFQR